MALYEDRPIKRFNEENVADAVSLKN